MASIKVLIVEDEWIISEEIKEILLQMGYEVIGQAEDAMSALGILEKRQANVALLDINIKGSIDGIDLASKISELYSCAIIFLTAFDSEQYLKRAKEISPSAYIVKPFEARNLQVAVEMAFNNLVTSKNPPKEESYIVSDYIFLKENSRFKRIELKKIHYAQAMGSYTDIFSEEGKFTIAINLKTFESEVNDHRFLRVHRSYLINLDHVIEYEGNRLFIDGSAIPISATHKEKFLKHLKFI